MVFASRSDRVKRLPDTLCAAHRNASPSAADRYGAHSALD
jgi:hypothetical protein